MHLMGLEALWISRVIQMEPTLQIDWFGMGLRHSAATELKQGVLRMWLSWEGVYLACTKPLFGLQDSMN